MPLSQTPAGNFPTALLGTAWLIASSPTFQTLVGLSGGQATAANALPFVKLEADDSEESGSTRPRAIVYPAPAGYVEVAEDLDNFRPSFRFWVSFELVPPNTITGETPRETRLWDEMLWFTNQVQAVLEDCKTLNGAGSSGCVNGIGQVRLYGFRLLDGPSAVEEARAEGEAGETSVYFYGVTFEFELHG